MYAKDLIGRMAIRSTGGYSDNPVLILEASDNEIIAQRKRPFIAGKQTPSEILFIPEYFNDDDWEPCPIAEKYIKN